MTSSASEVRVDEFFEAYEGSRRLFDALYVEINRLDSVEIRVSKSQIAFHRCRSFAWAWVPGRYLHGPVAPLVLSVALRRRDQSPRWKEVVEPARGRFMHHLELHSPAEIDREVVEWLREAWNDAA